MADQAEESGKNVLRKKGLPPITSKVAEDLDPPQEVIKRRPKKKKADTNTHPPDNSLSTSKSKAEDQEQSDKPTSRQRGKKLTNQMKDKEEGPNSEAERVPKKKKKKPRTEETGEAANQNTNSAQEKDGQGSKTSLINEEGTPRKKVGKKKKRAKKEVNVDEFGENTWAYDLNGLADDIISGDEKEKEEQDDNDEKVNDTRSADQLKETKKEPLTFLTAPVLRSQPLEKIFIETSNKFKGQRKNTLAMQRLEENSRPQEISPPEIPRATTIDFAIASHKIFRVFSLFLHGLTAGILVWQMIMVYVLSSSFSDDDFLEHYYRVSMPLQASLYFLLVLGTVSACDRFDIGNPSRRFLLRALTMQNGAVAIVFSLVALIINIVLVKYDDKMYLYKEQVDLFADISEKSDDISMFRSLNTARSVLVILCWFVLSVTPTCDRLGKNLKSGETGLEMHLDLDKVSAA